MVRVIQVHNFKRQTTFNMPDNLIVSRVISSERILNGRSDGTIELRSLNVTETDDESHTFDMNQESELIHSFSTIDYLETMEYCTTGHYILTLETSTMVATSTDTSVLDGNKPNMKYIRVYINWDPEQTNYKTKQVRARLASRVSPSNSDCDMNFFEMIEIPYRCTVKGTDDVITMNEPIGQPVCLSCCQISGNLCVGLDNQKILFYKFFYRRQHDKKIFIDFDQIQYLVHLDFIPATLFLTENLCIVKNTSFLNAFQIIESTSTIYTSNDYSYDLSDTISQEKKSAVFPVPDLAENFNANDLKLLDKKMNSQIIIHGQSNVEFMNRRCKFTESTITMCGDGDNNGIHNIGNDQNRIIIHNPNSNIQLIQMSQMGNSTLNKMKHSLKNILQLKCDPSQVSALSKHKTLTVLNSPTIDSIKLISLRPMYLKSRQHHSDLNQSIFSKGQHQCADNSIPAAAANPSKPISYNCSFSNDLNDLRSFYYRDYLGCGLCVATSEDCYMYFLEKNDKSTDDGRQQHHLLESYTFTAPLIDLVLDDTFIYAVTNVGIEIYTSKIGHYLFNGLMEENSSIIKSPKIDFPVCSIDMRPFLNLKRAYICDKKFTALAKVSNKWTLYSLQLPDTVELENAFSNKALEHLQKEDDDYQPNDYVEHLLGEAHVFIRMVKELAQIKPNARQLIDLNGGTNQTKFANSSQLAELSTNIPIEIIESYKKTCLQLGDYYVMKPDFKEYSQAAAYYTMGEINLTTILERNLKKNPKSIIGLVYTLKRLIRIITRDPDELINFQKPNEKFLSILNRFFNLIIDLMPDEISKIAMQSLTLRESMRDKIHTFLMERNGERTIADGICLILYQVESGYTRLKIKQNARNLIESSQLNIFNIILPNWMIYFDTITTKCGNRVIGFSDFAEFSMNCTDELKILRHTFLGILLKIVIAERILKLKLIVKLFTDYITLNIGSKEACRNGQKLLKIFLEKFFIDYLEATKNEHINDDINLIASGGTNNNDITLNCGGNGQSPIVSNSTSSLSSLSSAASTSSTSSTISINQQHTNLSRKLGGHKQKYISESILILLRTYLDEWRKTSDQLQSINDCQTFLMSNATQPNMTNNDSGSVKFNFVSYSNKKMAFIANNFNMVEYQNYDIIGFNKRARFLNIMPPFFLLNDYHTSNITPNNQLFDNLLRKLRLILIKIQSICLCNLNPIKRMQEIENFLQMNPKLIGSQNVRGCLMLNQPKLLIEILVSYSPETLPTYLKDTHQLTTLMGSDGGNSGTGKHFFDFFLMTLKIYLIKLRQLFTKQSVSRIASNIYKYEYYFEIFKEILDSIVATLYYDEVRKIFGHFDRLKLEELLLNDLNKESFNDIDENDAVADDDENHDDNVCSNDSVTNNEFHEINKNNMNGKQKHCGPIVDCNIEVSDCGSSGHRDNININYLVNNLDEIFLEFLYKSYNCKQCEKTKYFIMYAVGDQMISAIHKTN